MTDQILPIKAILPAKKGSLFYLGFFLCTGTFGPFLYVYYAELGLTGQQVGWLATFFPLMTLLFATPLSSLADRKRWRVRLAQIGMTGVGLLLLFLRYPTTFSGIALLMLPLAIFFSPIMAIGDSLVARMAQRHELNYGGMRLWGSIGFATSAMVFGAFWQRLGFRPMFLAGALLSLPLIWIIGQLEEGRAKDENKQASANELIRDAGLVMLLVATFLAGISNSLSMTFEGIYVRSLGGGNFLIGMMTAFSAYSELPTMFYGHHIARRLRGPNTVILAYGLMASAYIGYVLVANPSILPIFAAIRGLGFGLFFTNTVRMIDERVPEEWSSTAQSLRTVGMFGLAPLIAGPLGGFIHDTFSPGAVFGLGALGLGLAAAVLWFASFRGDIK